MAAVLCALTCAALAGAVVAYDLAPVTPQMRSDAAAILAAAAASTATWDRLTYITDTFGPRLSGSGSLEAALNWARQTANSVDGLTSYSEPVQVPKWTRGYENATLSITDPATGYSRVKSLHMLGLGGAVGTGGRVIAAPVVVVSSYDDLMANFSTSVTGKIVIFNMQYQGYGETVGYRVQCGVWAGQLGAVAAGIKAIGPWGMQTPHTGGTSASATIPTFAVSMEDANQMTRMQARGQAMTLSLYMEASKIPGQDLPTAPSQNVILEVPGSDLADEVVIISGHMDSWDTSEGAMDDAGGAISSWEAVRLIKALGLQPRRTIRAILWTNEENGAMGGATYALDHAGELNRTSIAIESDEGAFSPNGLGFSGHPAALMQLQELGQLLAPLGAGNVTSGGGGTDIDPMCENGVPCAGLVVMDPRLSAFSNSPCAGLFDPSKVITSNDAQYSYFFYHHSTSDTPERMDPAQLQLVAGALAVWAISIANLPQLLPRDGPTPTPLPGPGGSGGSSGATATAVALGVTGALVAVGAGVFGFRVWRQRRRSAGGVGAFGATYVAVTGTA